MNTTTKQAPMPVYFWTTTFQFSHGHMPRGRGSWAFDFKTGNGPEFAPGCLLYTEAKRWATQRARELGVDRVIVCP